MVMMETRWGDVGWSVSWNVLMTSSDDRWFGSSEFGGGHSQPRHHQPQWPTHLDWGLHSAFAFYFDMSVLCRNDLL